LTVPVEMPRYAGQSRPHLSISARVPSRGIRPRSATASADRSRL